ncbi:helix-turn-helix transcriptional regulator [Nocardiopsis sp. MG754419]|uniref:helix-turn-helix transcriptional regulator n=1 Tax=Nocardiopsis sp. MG754419 TaxID=2259865 RepID=UPI001BAC3857|nr:helix-turn-helix transcriptional regulator [Nocardiopsis sp. MG754419]MBR8742060.1 helix-turn-helix transcriptional regulator [Nocardiopsis sp. MG754419]
MRIHDPSAVFVGRHPHLSTLAADGRRARRDGARAVLVCGEAGVGKTRLIEEHLRRVPGVRSAVGGCLEVGADGLPFAPFTALLRALLRAGGPSTAPTADLGRLLPELGGAGGGTDEGRARLFEAVLTFLEERARPEGLTLVLEDLHWADASTRDLLVFLLRNLGSAPVHLVVSVRTDDLHRAHPLRRLLPELQRLSRVGRLDVGPLSREEVGAQATALRGTGPDPEDLDLLWERSGGNPLFVESLVNGPAHIGSALPEGLRDLLLASVASLSEPTRGVLGLAATAGGRVPHTLLAAVARRAGISEEDLEAALRPAIDAQALRTTDEGYVFRHALLAEAVHADLLPGERVRAHRRYAEALHRGVPRMSEREQAVRLAHHAHAAHDRPLALEAAWRAADHVAAVDAYPEQMSLVERVLELWDQVPDAGERLGSERVDVLVRAAEACLVAGAVRHAVGHADDGLAALGITGHHGTIDKENPPAEAERIALLRHARALALMEMGLDGALEDLAEASVLLPRHHPRSAAVLATFSATLLMRGHHQHADTGARRALDLARELGDRRSEADALVTLGSLLEHRERGCGLADLERGIRLAREIGDVQAEIRGLTDLGGVLKSHGRVEESAEVSLEGLRRCRALGLTRTRGGAFVYGIAVTRFDQGRFDEAEALLDGIHDSGVVGARALVLRMHLDLYRWRPDAVRAAADRFRRVLPERDSAPVEHLPAHMVRQQLALHEGRLEDAGRISLTLLTSADGRRGMAAVTHGLYRSTLPWHAWVLALLAEEPDGESRLLAARIEEALDALPPDVIHSDARAAALAARAWRGRDPAASLELFERALDELGPTGPVVSHAEYHLGAAHAALRAEARDAAVRHVDALYDRAVAHGMTLFEREALVLRARHGWPEPGRPPVVGAAVAPAALTAGHESAASGTAASTASRSGLTRRELEVLTEVARGSSNREIGATLFISAKTVSVHITNLMNKLDVNNRTAAAAKGRDLGLL